MTVVEKLFMTRNVFSYKLIWLQMDVFDGFIVSSEIDDSSIWNEKSHKNQ